MSGEGGGDSIQQILQVPSSRFPGPQSEDSPEMTPPYNLPHSPHSPLSPSHLGPQPRKLLTLAQGVYSEGKS